MGSGTAVAKTASGIVSKELDKMLYESFLFRFFSFI